jgi:hypothetical protein
MSARQLDVAPVRERLLPVQFTAASPLSLPAAAVRVRRNGIEFHYSRPLAPWTEAVVRVGPDEGGKSLTCTGVVVSCTGSARTGYHVSMLFLGLAPRTQRRLAALAHSQLS